SGQFRVEAELVQAADDVIELRTSDGRTITVPLARLSAADREFVARQSAATSDEDAGAAAVTLGPAKTFTVRVGMEITGRGAATNVWGIVTVPMDWPEQTVRVVDKEQTREVGKVSYRVLNNGAKQMMIFVPRLRDGDTARATLTLEVEGHEMIGPAATAGLRLPQRPGADVRKYLEPGPETNSRDATIVDATSKAVAGVEGAWRQVQAIHDFAIDHVRYVKRDENTSATTALAAGQGDCHELSALFVAMCRAHGVPARCIWSPSHVHAEFYLEDAAGRGHWYPVESTNKEHFGHLPRTSVILQKGDNFNVPEFREPLHFARTVVKGSFGPGGAQPEFKEILEVRPTSP
ncbi:MAG: hypothetical protein KDA41_13785, partial [Planctomycetales bacterium]|nr:hypothetical protein [Planctomycetales bacterium]